MDVKMKSFFLVVTAGLFCGVLKADSLNYTVTTGVGAGQQFYQLTLTNSCTTGGTLLDLFVSLPIDISDINTATISSPPGWGDGTGGLLFFGPDANPFDVIY